MLLLSVFFFFFVCFCVSFFFFNDTATTEIYTLSLHTLFRSDSENIWLAKSGFGGTEYLLSALVSEGRKRGLSLNKMAELTSLNPARRYGLRSKGDIEVGLDADLALVDPENTWTIRAEESESGQGYTPFEGSDRKSHV